MFISVFEVTNPSRGCGTCRCDMHPMWDSPHYPWNKPQILTINNAVTHGGSLDVKSCLTLATTRTVARQASLFMGFSRQEYWSGLNLNKSFSSPHFTGEEIWDPNGAMLRGKPSLTFPTGPLPDLLVHSVWLLKVIHKEASFAFSLQPLKIPSGAIFNMPSPFCLLIWP